MLYTLKNSRRDKLRLARNLADKLNVDGNGARTSKRGNTLYVPNGFPVNIPVTYKL